MATQVKKKRKFDSILSVDTNSEQCFERCLGESLTVPDMSYTIKQLLEKYTSGIAPEITKVGYPVDGEVTFEDLAVDANMVDLTDMTEATHFLEDISRKIGDKKAEVAKAIKEKHEADMKELEELRKLKQSGKIGEQEDPKAV